MDNNRSSQFVRLLPVYPMVHANPAEAIPDGYRPRADLRQIRLHEIDFYVTMRCNLTCSFCSVRAGEYEHDELPLSRCIEIIEEAAALGLEELHFLGGEPTLRDDLIDMVAKATSLGISTRVITNGLILDRAGIAQFVGAGLGELMVSLDGLGGAHGRLRQCGSKGWERSMRCVRDALSVPIRTRVAATAYKDNIDDMLPLLRLCAEEGVHRFSIFLGSPLGRGHDMADRVIDPHAWRRLQDEVADALPQLDSPIDVIMEQGFSWTDRPAIDRSALKGRGTGCNTLLEDYDYLIVRADGRLYQCVFFMTEGRPIGSVERHGLRESLQYGLERRLYADFTVPKDKCVSCSHQGECGTGCRGYAYLLKGDWLVTDPRCSKADPRDASPPEFYPVCPILKWNVRKDRFGGSSEQALE